MVPVVALVQFLGGELGVEAVVRVGHGVDVGLVFAVVLARGLEVRVGRTGALGSVEGAVLGGVLAPETVWDAALLLVASGT